MELDCDFDGGSIEVLSADDPANVSLALRRDNASDFSQWFCFRVRVAPGTACGFRIENAGQSSYPGGWSNYRVCASYDGEAWFRIDTEYSDGALRFRHEVERDLVVFACFAPFTTERYEALIERARRSARARVIEIGRSVQGRPMNVVAFGDQGRRVPRVWIIALQHPGETMAGFCAEGIVDRLLDESDEASAALLARAEVYVIPRMNPDGSAIGNHRTNAAGLDLNRQWTAPSDEASPEVASVVRALEAGGVDMLLDIHGDETIPYVFAFGAEGVPRYSGRLAGLEDRFCGALSRIDPDFQREQGYERDPPGEADLRLANMYVAERFDCLSLGLELPFKDDLLRPDEVTGWSPDRSRGFGRSLVLAVLEVVGELR